MGVALPGSRRPWHGVPAVSTCSVSRFVSNSEAARPPRCERGPSSPARASWCGGHPLLAGRVLFDANDRSSTSELSPTSCRRSVSGRLAGLVWWSGLRRRPVLVVWGDVAGRREVVVGEPALDDVGGDCGESVAVSTTMTASIRTTSVSRSHDESRGRPVRRSGLYPTSRRRRRSASCKGAPGRSVGLIAVASGPCTRSLGCGATNAGHASSPGPSYSRPALAKHESMATAPPKPTTQDRRRMTTETLTDAQHTPYAPSDRGIPLGRFAGPLPRRMK